MAPWMPIGRGEDGQRLRGCLARYPAPINTVSGTPTAAAITSRTPSTQCLATAFALQSLETSFHQDLNGGRRGRSPYDGDRGARVDQPGSGRETTISCFRSGDHRAPLCCTTARSWRWVKWPRGCRSARRRRPAATRFAWHVTGADQYNRLEHRQQRQFRLKPMLALYLATALRCNRSKRVFHQDLNGDGVVGPHTTVIEAQGSTSLVQVANDYFLFPIGGSSGPPLLYNGALVAVGQMAPWICRSAAERRRPAATRLPGTSPALTNTSSGTPTAAAISSQPMLALYLATALRCNCSKRVSHQDLNGDGVVGPHTTVIEAQGSTSPGSGRERLFSCIRSGDRRVPS